MTNARIESDSVTVTANSTPTAIDTFAVATYTTAKYLLQMKQGTKMTVTELVVTWDGTDVSWSEYGIINSGTAAVNAILAVAHVAGTITLSASSSDAATTNVVIKSAVTYIKA